MGKLQDLADLLRHTVARWLDPVTYDHYEQIVNNLDAVTVRCGYDFPTVRVVHDWVLTHGYLAEVRTPTVEDVRDWLQREHAGTEPIELSRRLEQMLLEVYGEV